MPGKAAVYGFMLVILVSFIVCMVQFFVPLSIKADMNSCCRDTLLKMEIRGGLSAEDMEDLRNRLAEKGLFNITIQGTQHAKQGESLFLRVDAYFKHPRLTGLFTGSKEVRHLVYHRTATTRRVVN